MRRILSSVLLGIVTSASLLNAQDPKSAPVSLADLARRGQLPQVIQAANSLLEKDKLAPAGQAEAFVFLGYAYQETGEFTRAVANYEKALAVLDREGQHPSEYAATLSALGLTYADIGQIDTAKRMLLRSVHLYEKENNHAGAAMTWNHLADIAAKSHSGREAHKDIARSLAESHLAGSMSPSQLAAITTTQGMIAELGGDPRSAILDYQHALDLWNQTHKDEQQKKAWLYVVLGRAYLQDGDIANARENTSRGLAILEATSGRQTPRYFAAQLIYSKVLDASGAHDEASTLREAAQAGLNTGTDREHAEGQISIFALR